MTWTRFMDMHSGGGLKEEWQYIYIEASLEEAKSVFYSRFGHNPERVTCTCCGEDYSISEYKTLEEATAYDRHCYWAYPKNDRFGSNGRYFESTDDIPKGWKVDDFHFYRRFYKNRGKLFYSFFFHQRRREKNSSSRTGICLDRIRRINKMEELKNKLQKIARLRVELQIQKEWGHKLFDELKAMELYKQHEEVLEMVRELNATLSELETSAREIIEELAYISGDKKVLPGATAKEYTVVNIKDEDAAKAWAAANAPSVLTLNVSKFGSAVKLLELPFVEKKTELRGQLASDLSDYLEDND